MSINLEKTLTDRVKYLTKQRRFYYEFLVIDNKCQIVNKGIGEVSIIQFTGVTKALIENIKNIILKDTKQNCHDCLDFSTTNIFLSSVLELKDEHLENKEINVEEEFKKLLAELESRIPKFDLAQTGNSEETKEYLANIYVSKVFDIYRKLLQENRTIQQQSLYEELASTLKFLPEQVQQLLLDFFKKVS